MNRQQCEQQIKEKLKEIIGIYHQYNPEGGYLSLAYSVQDGSQHISFFNSYWGPDGDDVAAPICYMEFKEEGEAL